MGSDRKPGRTDAQHRGKMDEAKPNEAGHAGGAKMPREGAGKGGEDLSQEEMEREKARRGKGSPA